MDGSAIILKDDMKLYHMLSTKILDEEVFLTRSMANIKGCLIF